MQFMAAVIIKKTLVQILQPGHHLLELLLVKIFNRNGTKCFKQVLEEVFNVQFLHYPKMINRPGIRTLKLLDPFKSTFTKFQDFFMSFLLYNIFSVADQQISCVTTSPVSKQNISQSGSTMLQFMRNLVLHSFTSKFPDFLMTNWYKTKIQACEV